MDIIPASADEIAAFKLAAVETYKKAGLTPKQASDLFERTMSGIATELGLGKQGQLSEVAEKLAPALDDIGLAAVRAIKKKREAMQDGMTEAKENLATKISEAFGRKRAQAFAPPAPVAATPAAQPPAAPTTAPAVPTAPAAPKPKAPTSMARSSNQ